MNLHIVPDSKFSEAFYNNLSELKGLDNNKFFVSTNQASLTHIKDNLPFGSLYSDHAKVAIGDTQQYDRVFIHLFSPLMYRWVATHTFRELNWMVWGVDLYHLPFIDFNLYEPRTQRYTKTHWTVQHLLYMTKLYATGMPFMKRAYAKVDRVFTWMTSEYEFARKHLPVLQAAHEFFFYENQTPYNKITVSAAPREAHDTPLMILGNSAIPALNHLDAIEYLERKKIRTRIVLPVSYGDKAYTAFLKKQLAQYSFNDIHLADEYMDFDKYLNFLNQADGLIMNNIRPQGYGNIFLMLFLNKPVFVNEKNISLPDLTANGIAWNRMSDIDNFHNGRTPDASRHSIINMFSHDKLVQIYSKHFC